VRRIPGGGAALLFAGCLLAGLAGMLWLLVELDARSRPEIVVTISDNPDTIHVAIENGVESPGVYELPTGSRLADLIEAAGGADGTADLASANLAQRLKDESLIHLPPLVDLAESTEDESANPQQPIGFAYADPRLNLNTATVDALDGLPGIGPVLAEAIIAERERLGGFQSVDDLVGIDGISQRMVDAFRDMVTVEP
jgi:competence protein ComEA